MRQALKLYFQLACYKVQNMAQNGYNQLTTTDPLKVFLFFFSFSQSHASLSDSLNHQPEVTISVVPNPPVHTFLCLMLNLVKPVVIPKISNVFKMSLRLKQFPRVPPWH